MVSIPMVVLPIAGGIASLSGPSMKLILQTTLPFPQRVHQPVVGTCLDKQTYQSNLTGEFLGIIITWVDSSLDEINRHAGNDQRLCIK